MSQFGKAGDAPPREVLAAGTLRDFDAALESSDFPLVVWSTTTGEIRLANRQAAATLKLSLEDLIGRSIFEFAPDPDDARTETGFIASGGGGFFGARNLQDASGQQFTGYLWTRAIQVADRNAAVSLCAPAAERGRLGRDPTRPLQDLYRLAVGAVTDEWQIVAVSAELAQLTGRQGASVGRRLLDLVDPRDVAKLTDEHGSPPTAPTSVCSVRTADARLGWKQTCWLFAPLDDGHTAFAVMCAEPTVTSSEERVAELALRLRRIAAEVNAAGILENLAAISATVDSSKLDNLTTRQWEILTLLLQGKRVPTIASELYVSQSTVRNHLAVLFKRFGVHSQPELLEVLRS